MEKYFDYNYIVYEDSLHQIVKENPIIFSNTLNNDFLAMMYADFVDNSEVVSANLFDNSDLTNEQLEILSEVGIVQLGSDGEQNQYDFYTYVSDSKLIALKVPSGVAYLKLSYRLNDEVIEESDEIDVSTLVTVSKLIFLVQSSQKLNNLSPLIHQYSIKPHNDLVQKIITEANFNEQLSIVVIDDNLYDNQAQIKLGDKTSEYKTQVTPTFTTYENRLIINGKLPYE